MLVLVEHASTNFFWLSLLSGFLGSLEIKPEMDSQRGGRTLATFFVIEWNTKNWKVYDLKQLILKLLLIVSNFI